MHPDDVLITGVCAGIGVGLLLVGVATIWTQRRKYAARLERFREACRGLGLSHGKEDWYGERDGVRVGVSWVECSVGHTRNAALEHFTAYTARFDPPLDTGMVLYTGVERYVKTGGGETHVAEVEHWNDRPLPTGGSLWDVVRTPERATVRHVDGGYPLREIACVYGSDPDEAHSLISGELGEVLAPLVEGTAFCWMDDSTLLAYVRGDGDGPRPKRVTASSFYILHWPHADAQRIEAWLSKMATLANDVRRVAR